MMEITARKCWQQAYGEARSMSNERSLDVVLHRALVRFFGSMFPPAFPRTFAASPVSAAVATDWWLAGGIAAGDCWEAHQPKGAASYALSLLNLNDPGTHDAIDSYSPGWNATDGWQFGSNAYLDTTFVPTSDQIQTAIIQFTNNSGNSGSRMFGSIESAGTFMIQPSGGGGGWVAYGNGGWNAVGPVLASSGNVAIAGSNAYRDGALDTGGIGGWSGTPSLTVWIGNMNDGAHNWYSHPYYCVAFALYTKILSGAQVAAVRAAMAAL